MSGGGQRTGTPVVPAAIVQAKGNVPRVPVVPAAIVQAKGNVPRVPVVPAAIVQAKANVPRAPVVPAAIVQAKANVPRAPVVPAAIVQAKGNVPRMMANPVGPSRPGVIQRYIRPDRRWPLAQTSTAMGDATGQRMDFWPDVKWVMYNGFGSIRRTPNEMLGQALFYMCMECGRFYPEQAMNIDHIVPWNTLRQGLTTRKEEIEAYNDLRNLQLLCTSCNLAKLANENWHYANEPRAGLIDQNAYVQDSLAEMLNMTFNFAGYYRNPNPPVRLL